MFFKVYATIEGCPKCSNLASSCGTRSKHGSCYNKWRWGLCLRCLSQGLPSGLRGIQKLSDGFVALQAEEVSEFEEEEENEEVESDEESEE